MDQHTLSVRRSLLGPRRTDHFCVNSLVESDEDESERKDDNDEYNAVACGGCRRGRRTMERRRVTHGRGGDAWISVTAANKDADAEGSVSATSSSHHLFLSAR